MFGKSSGIEKSQSQSLSRKDKIDEEKKLLGAWHTLVLFICVINVGGYYYIEGFNFKLYLVCIFITIVLHILPNCILSINSGNYQNQKKDNDKEDKTLYEQLTVFMKIFFTIKGLIAIPIMIMLFFGPSFVWYYYCNHDTSSERNLLSESIVMSLIGAGISQYIVKFLVLSGYTNFDENDDVLDNEFVLEQKD